ncbi:isoprenoid synthase domain-containing protein [Crucibulum laeve]|uniref:(2E,6E)-farnesyl diphosphate synthase n=1 Tax=Crucibulum laeve TaxID=68775 RepID=A0A5C3LJ96_9AGAR|nr:isoprenoid synthase domain-containing protein [Crucibulum laeve]
MHRRCIPRIRASATRKTDCSRSIPHRHTSTQPPTATASPNASSIPPTASTSSIRPRADPFNLVAPQIAELRQSLLPLLASGHPALSEITKYYFQHPSKQIRPVIVLLLAQATNGLGGDWGKKLWEAEQGGAGLDTPFTRPDVLNDWNPSMPEETSRFEATWPLSPAGEHRRKGKDYVPPMSGGTRSALCEPMKVLPTQRRLAQIVEMLHTASLLHDDVIDESALRRGAPSAPAAFGNKLSVLGGNFVLGRASAALSRLGDTEVTELIASVISNLVEGEILQMREVKLDGKGDAVVKAKTNKNQEAWNIYLQKTYLKTASLMAKGARSSVVLGGCKEGEAWKEIAYAYGRNLGIAFQLVDDVLDYESASVTLGKPGGADLQLGLATGPALYAWEEHPEMGELIQRKFEKPGDVELARDYVLRSSGVQRTKALAQAYADKAKEVLQELPSSEAKEALEALTERVVGRRS